jgi:hypothetical protein
MNKEQYQLLKNAFIVLQDCHNNAKKGLYDFKTLNNCADVISPFESFKDFDKIRNHILKEIGGL